MSNATDPLLERDDGPLYSRASVDEGTVDDEARSVEVVASTEDIDRHGTILRANWKLDDFRENPIVLFAHNSRELPIGTASDVRVTEGKLRAKITFNAQELNDQAERVWQNVKAKKIRGVSVGFFPHSVKFEKHEDRDVLVLDENELLEISIVPVPSNPKALAGMRARALAARDVLQPETIPAPAPPVAENQPQPEPPEKRTMTEPKPINILPAIVSALGLMPGATETDVIAACGRMRELELGIQGITGVAQSSEALGSVRALKATAADAEKLRAENAELKAARDQQEFDALILNGTSQPIKLSLASVQEWRGWFDTAKNQARGSEIVAQLRGFLKTASPIIAERKHPPKGEGSGGGTALVWNGKTYAQLTFAQRATLKTENKELHALMKRDWEDAGSPPAPNAAA